MELQLPGFITSTWERNIVGDNFYDLTSFNNWCTNTSNSVFAQNHPILTPGILFIAKVFSQAKFRVKNSRTHREDKNHWLIKLLKNPNGYQTQQDFLETLMFSMISNGKAVVYKKYNIAFDEPRALYILDPNLIKWPDDIKQMFKSTSDFKTLYGNRTVTYDQNGENIEIKIKDLMFFYDLPNCLNKNPFNTKSRLDGLKQTLINTQDSLIAKNIILKTNGKELVSAVKDGFPLGTDEKAEVENLFHANYGLARNRKRGLITQASLDHKSLHIALRDLGLDESIKVDGNIIFTALHIPKDILSLEAKKTTYNNFKESMVSYMQNETQSTLNAVIAVFQREITGANLELEGDYEHLPIMQFVLIERYEAVSKRAKALNDLLRTGIPEEIALELCGFDKSIELNEIHQLNGTQESNSNQQQREEANNED